MNKFKKFRKTTLFPNWKKETIFDIILKNIKCFFGKHTLTKCKFGDEIYLYCENCKYTETDGKKVKRNYNKDITFDI